MVFPRLLLALFLPSPILSTSVYGAFSNPPDEGLNSEYQDDVVWTIDTVQTLRWTTTLQTYNITLIQQLKPPEIKRWDSPIYSQESGNTGSYEWVVQIPGFMSLAESPVFFLGVDFTDVIGTGFTSHYFNITIEDAAPNSTSSSTVPVPTQSASSAPTQESGGTSSAVKVGVGVGVSLGVCLLLLVGYVIWLRRARKNRAQLALQQQQPLESAAYAQDPSFYNMKYEQQPQQPVVFEAMGSDQMPGSAENPLEMDTAHTPL